MTYNLRMKTRRKELRLTQEAVAAACGWKKSRIANYESSFENEWHREPSIEDFKKIATALETTPEWLQFGVGNNEHAEINTMADVYAGIPVGKVPVIEWSEATQWVDASEEPIIKKDWQFIDFPGAHKKMFALRIKNDAMDGSPKRFTAGSIIIVDPALPRESGNYVVTIMGLSREPIFRQLIIEGDKTLLKPLNPQYQIEKMNFTDRHLGVVIEHRDLL